VISQVPDLWWARKLGQKITESPAVRSVPTCEQEQHKDELPVA